MPPRIPRSALSALKPITSAEPEISPLAAAIAARMSGQLQGAGELLGLKGANMPAAYAGDQRSMGALTRILNEQETGLASPGRRKFMKQTAATAARQAIPDAVTHALGTNVLKNGVKDVIAQPSLVSTPYISLDTLEAELAENGADSHLVDTVLNYLWNNSERTDLLDAGEESAEDLLRVFNKHAPEELQKALDAAAKNPHLRNFLVE